MSSSLGTQAVQKMELSMEARGLCSNYLTAEDGKFQRARDVLHLDIVLTGTVRTVIEANLDHWLALLKDMFSSKGTEQVAARACPCGLHRGPVRSLHCGGALSEES